MSNVSVVLFSPSKLTFSALQLPLALETHWSTCASSFCLSEQLVPTTRSEALHKLVYWPAQASRRQNIMPRQQKLRSCRRARKQSFCYNTRNTLGLRNAQYVFVPRSSFRSNLLARCHSSNEALLALRTMLLVECQMPLSIRAARSQTCSNGPHLQVV